MKRFIDDKGSLVISAVVLVIASLICAFFISRGHKAEAVIGGVGNVTASNNPHNLSSTSSGIKAQSERQICIFCHTPHFAIKNTALIDGPLWNHQLSEATYTVNAVGQIFYNGTIGNLVLLTSPPDKPDGTSRMCLSCHDGTVAVGAVQVGNITMDTHSCLVDGKLVSGSGCAYIGTDLTKKHVVSVPMNQGLLDASLANCTNPGNPDHTTYLKYPWTPTPANMNVVLRPTYIEYPTSSGSPGIDGADILLDDDCGLIPACENKYKGGYNYGVQCSVCHDPHYWTGDTDNSSPGYKFIVDSFNNLCKACHVNCPP